MSLVLASTSPQRRAILTQLGFDFRVVEPAYVEKPLAVPPAELVETHSRGKARSVERTAGETVIGVDTIVVCDGDVLGKPADACSALDMLRRLAGREHTVCSGLTVIDDLGERTAHAGTRVVFRELADVAIRSYVDLEEWRGRAGGYAIQERGALLVERVEGDYLNVVGLPVALLVKLLEAAG